MNEQNPQNEKGQRTKAESTIFWRGRRLEGLANPAGSKRSGTEVERHGGELRGGTVLEEEHGVGVRHHEECAQAGFGLLPAVAITMILIPEPW